MMSTQGRGRLIGGLVSFLVAVPMVAVFGLVGGVGHAAASGEHDDGDDGDDGRGPQIESVTLPGCAAAKLEGFLKMSRKFTGTVELKLFTQPHEATATGFGGTVPDFEDTGLRAYAMFDDSKHAAFAFDPSTPMPDAGAYELRMEGAEHGGMTVPPWHSGPFPPCKACRTQTCTTSTLTLVTTATKTLTVPITTTVTAIVTTTQMTTSVPSTITTTTIAPTTTISTTTIKPTTTISTTTVKPTTTISTTTIKPTTTISTTTVAPTTTTTLWGGTTAPPETLDAKKRR